MRDSVSLRALRSSNCFSVVEEIHGFGFGFGFAERERGSRSHSSSMVGVDFFTGKVKISNCLLMQASCLKA